MGRKSRFQKSFRHISAFFKEERGNVFSENDLKAILFNYSDDWKLAKGYTAKKFIKDLEMEEVVDSYAIHFNGRSDVTRWCHQSTPLITRVSKIRKNLYLSHFTACVAHGLTLQIPKSYFINQELSPKNQPKKVLKQEDIDMAYKKEFRYSNNVGYINNVKTEKYYYLQSKNTNHTGIIRSFFENTEVNITNIERTLIDITVSPQYAGGVFQVLEAYRRAADRVSVNKLMAYLKKFDYTYPFHQAVGFYLEKSGAYSVQQLNLVKKLKKEYDFYLAHELKEMEFEKDWRIFYPKGL